jgi:urease accessory protein
VHLIQRHVSEVSARPAGEQVCLCVERRQFLKRRWRGVAEDGTEFGFDLEARLPEGAVIFQSETRDYIVRQRPETVYVLRPGSPEAAALVGWRIGNLHLPVEVVSGVVRVVHDPAVPLLCAREGWPLIEETVVFNPLRIVAHAS